MTIEELRATSRDQIISIAADCGAANIRVFGSVARGEADSRSDDTIKWQHRSNGFFIS